MFLVGTYNFLGHIRNRGFCDGTLETFQKVLSAHQTFSGAHMKPEAVGSCTSCDDSSVC